MAFYIEQAYRNEPQRTVTYDNWNSMIFIMLCDAVCTRRRTDRAWRKHA